MRQGLGMANRTRLAALLAVALVVRALVPTGWMPVATAQGVRLALCPGQDVTPPAMAGMHHGHERDGKQPPPDHPCAFAGLGLAADTAPPFVIPSAAPVAPPLVAAHPLAVTVGRGLAAPPPPATGPPAFG